jgi:acyl-CoA thioester hydrolase
MKEAEPVVRMPLRVRYHECDPQGIVFNAHYLAYADMASFECLKVFGAPAYPTERGIDLVAAESAVRYLAACRFEDGLAVEVFVDRVGTTSLVLSIPMRRGQDTVAEVTNRYVWINTQTLRPAPPPPDIRDAFARQIRATP